MRSMLNQFYKYLSNKLISFFESEGLSGGERYYLQFDREDQVCQFYEVLKYEPCTEEFSYQHQYGSPYHTFGLRIGDCLVIVAATINNVTPDFLVTLRNLVGDQKGEFKNTALLSICHETLDSIKGGSSDLQKEGMPFHVHSIKKNLEDEINQSNLTKAEKAVINFYLKTKLSNMLLHPSLDDFAEVLALLNQGYIEKDQYPKLGLFYDNNLDQFTTNQMITRLEENNRFFEQVQYIHEYENLDTQLEKLFDDKGVTELKKDNWKELEYSFVKKSNENLMQSKKKALEYIESNKKTSDEGLLYWEKPQSETKAGQRKRHIILFNPERKTEVNLTFEFDEYLKKEYIHKNSVNFASTSGKRLKVKLVHQPGEISFYKISYKHKNETKSTYEFHIAIVECSSEFLKPIQTIYEIKTNQQCIILHNDGETIRLGTNPITEIMIEKPNETIELSSEEDGVEISISPNAWIDDSLEFTVRINNFILPFKIMDQVARMVPISGKQVYKLKREKRDHFLLMNNRLQLGAREFSIREEFKTYLDLENEWIENEILFAHKEGTRLEAIDLKLPEDLENSYLALLTYYKDHNLLPSLAYLNEDLQVLCQEYLDQFNKCIQQIEENSILEEFEKNLFKLGVIQEDERIYLTPLHPLNVAYQLAIMDQLDDEELEQHILDRLRPNNLLPFIYGDYGDLYRPIVQQIASEWIIYEPLKQVSVGESNVYLANVIEEKLNQFIEHFQYLFLDGSNAPIKVNIINITNDEEVLKGIFNFMKQRIEKYGLQQLIPIEIALYQTNDNLSAFELFSVLDVDALEERFGLELSSKELDPVDLLRIIRENIYYYKIKDTGNYEYAHISFYKMISQDSHAKDNMDEIETGISLHGLLSSVTSVTGRQDYRTGFGTKNIINKENRLVQTAMLLNELASNLENDGSNPYRKNESIVTRTSEVKEEILDALYNSSYWVTFIDPNVGLDFFQRSDRELLIIHYSDQYTSSNQYDAITVTDKTEQYRQVIKQYLEEQFVSATDEQIDSAIRSFNTINGEWLLRIVGSKGQFSREKLSIVSAIKYSLSFLDTENIIWVPISLEEILRVAGVVNLTKSKGLFSAKNLGITGSTSDDLLLVGLETKEDELYLHFYPVEVKVGFNSSSTISKAKEQINTTRRLLDQELARAEEQGRILFRNRFFRNFFVDMFLANAKKFVINELWPEKSFDLIEEVKAKLLNDEYRIGYHLRPYIGKGMILSFKKDATWRSARMDEEILILELSEEDAYTGVIQEIEEIRKRIHKGETDINTSILPTYNYRPVSNDELLFVAEKREEYKINGTPQEETSETPVEVLNPLEAEKITQDLSTKKIEEPNKEDMEGTEGKQIKKTDIQEVRLLLGTVEGSTHPIYWEYGHSGLENRHLLVLGKSGQGKTYFIQCLLLELAAQNISSIVFDYTGGFTKSKLEPEFKEFLGDNIEQIIVARDKFPINPFKRNQKELDEDIYIDEDFSDVAERMKSVFGAVYKDLGIQQLNAIYQAIMRGLEKYGDGINLQILRSELEEDSSGPAKTALSQLNPLIDKDPFDRSKEFNWGDIENAKGKVFIIQLNGFASDIQKVITEFILWDLWYYKLQHGNQNMPLPVVLDEAQNLDHSEKSPSAKILTEGRKFGWSGWYATQFLKGLLSSDEISRLQQTAQKIYFLPPENEMSSIAANLSFDQSSRREWERRLASLKKGQCISYGPIMGRDGKLHRSEPVIVNITPLAERIKLIKQRDMIEV